MRHDLCKKVSSCGGILFYDGKSPQVLKQHDHKKPVCNISNNVQVLGTNFHKKSYEGVQIFQWQLATTTGLLLH